MLRITRQARRGAVVLKLEGRLVEDACGELQRACKAEPSPVTLDFTHVRFMDRAGESMVKRLEQEGFRLTGVSGFIERLLRRGDSLA